MANTINELPFSGLTDFSLQELFMNDKAYFDQLFESNGFNDYIKENSLSNFTDGVSNINCNYYSIDSYKQKVKRNDKMFKIINFNIRRIAANMAELIVFLSNLETAFDIVILSEIGDDAENYLNNYNFPGYDFFFKSPVGNRYGGVAIMVREGTGTVTLRSDLMLEKKCECNNCAWEDIWLDISSSNKKKTIGAIYRHPHGNSSHFTESLDNSLSLISDKNLCIVSGDINLDLIKYEETKVNEYFTTMCTHNFNAYITLPSRITYYSNTIIDHTFIRFPRNKSEPKVVSGNILANITDHLPTFAIINSPDYVDHNDRPYIRLINEKNIAKFREIIDQNNWNQILDNEEPDIMCDRFYNILNQAYHQSFPLIKLSRKKSRDKPWVTKG